MTKKKKTNFEEYQEELNKKLEKISFEDPNAITNIFRTVEESSEDAMEALIDDFLNEANSK
jgi:hypothetical protein